MKMIFIALFFLIFLSSSEAAINSVPIHINWEYKDFGPKATIYGVKEGTNLWETRNVNSLKEVPVTEVLKDATFTLAPGGIKRFAVVIQNKDNNPIYFFAAPHQTSPAEYSLGSKIKCLCIGRSYRVGGNETWYRVLEFRLSKNYVGKELTVTHSIIGIDENRAKAFSKGSELPDF
jgi:hypothetical protein